MNEINLYILDIANTENQSGVDRYIKMLLDGLKTYSFIRVYRIQLLRDAFLVLYKEEKKGHYINMVLPFPQEFDEIVSEPYWNKKYNEYVFHIIKHLFENKSNCILHIHTLNLINLALLIKSKVSCKIITHLHCIPWKSLYNTDKKRFNRLYAKLYLKEDNELEKEEFFVFNCESDAYTYIDRIICVTESGKKFISDLVPNSCEKISVVFNGMNDFGKDKVFEVKKKKAITFNCLFVGVLSESKGIFYLFETLRLIQAKGYKPILNMAGTCNHRLYQYITAEYKDLSINLLGKIPFEDLKMFYRESDIGIITSLQEQCSYVAIEMAMFGLPVVTTAADGLDEIYTDNINALKVNILFSKIFGLRVNTNMMAEKIIELVENVNLRKRLSENARKLYKEKFSLNKMMEETVTIYKNVVYG
jgi:glycosyltransferase involved in cell wall biosynthesis